MTDLSALRKAFAQKPSVSDVYYQFYLMQTNQTTKIRCLPNKGELLSHVFLHEITEHYLTINGDRRRVPCLGMYDEDCPICAVAQKFYRAGDEISGSKYYKKKKYLGNAQIVEDPLGEGEDSAVGQVRVVSFSNQLFKLISEELTREDNDIDPIDYKEGYDLIIKKTKKGQWADYTAGTGFSRKPRAIDDKTIKLLEEKLFDIRTFVPKNPGIDVVNNLLRQALSGEEEEQETTESSEHSEEEKKSVVTDDVDNTTILEDIKSRRRAKNS